MLTVMDYLWQASRWNQYNSLASWREGLVTFFTFHFHEKLVQITCRINNSSLWLTSNVCLAKTWFILFFCATYWHFCQNVLKTHVPLTMINMSALRLQFATTTYPCLCCICYKLFSEHIELFFCYCFLIKGHVRDPLSKINLLGWNQRTASYRQETKVRKY